MTSSQSIFSLALDFHTSVKEMIDDMNEKSSQLSKEETIMLLKEHIENVAKKQLKFENLLNDSDPEILNDTSDSIKELIGDALAENLAFTAFVKARVNNATVTDAELESTGYKLLYVVDQTQKDFTNSMKKALGSN